MFASEVTALAWLGVAFVAAMIEVSVPHFGSAFVSAGAVAAAAAATAPALTKAEPKCGTDTSIIAATNATPSQASAVT